MTVRFALQGRIVERTLAYAGAFLVVLLEPPRFHYPRSRARWVERRLRPVRCVDGVWLCLSVSERWI
jgi:hypothetical protein